MKMLVSAVTAVLVLAACASAEKDPLLGTWESQEGGLTLQFVDNGTFASKGPRGSTAGRYSPAEDGQIRMEFDGMSELFAVSVSDDRLTFCQPNHHCEKFRRAK
jgi:hypothetical protein